MPLPVDYGTGTVTGTFTDTNGDPVVGTISFTPSASRLLGTGAVILGDPVVVPLDDAGSLTVILPASDDPNVSPTDFTYRVDETFVGTVGSTYFIDVLEGVTLDLADVLVPGTVNNGTVIWAAQLPSQTGNAGKLLRTDGTDLSWAGLGSVIADASAKVTPVGADEFVMSDSAAAGVAKRISFTDLSAAIGGGAVDSVNGQTGAVVLDADDIGDGTTNKAYTAAEQSKLAAITGTNTGDQTLPTLASLGAVPTSRTLAGLDLSADRTAAALRTALGLVIGTDVLAPNGSGASLTGIPESAVTDLVTDLAAKAPLASPTFTGTPAAPTAAAGTATTQVATTAFVGAAAPARPRVVGAYAHGALSTRTGTLHDATALGRFLVFPTWLWAGDIDRIYVRTGVAAVSTWRIGIYPLDATTLKPDGQTKLSGTDSSINMNATAGTLEATITATIPLSGLWGMAVLVDAYTATPNVHSVSSDGSANLGWARPWSVTGQSVSGSPQFDGIAFMATGVTTGVSALPTTCPTTAPNAQTPVVGVRYA